MKKQKILFIGEDLIKSKSGVVTVMNQILGDEYLKEKVEFVTIFTTSDDYSLAKKLIYWSIAYIKFLYYLPSADMIHIHHASDLNFWLSSVMVRLANLFNKKSLLHNHSADFHDFYNKKKSEVKQESEKFLSLPQRLSYYLNHGITGTAILHREQRCSCYKTR